VQRITFLHRTQQVSRSNPWSRDRLPALRHLVVAPCPYEQTLKHITLVHVYSVAVSLVKVCDITLVVYNKTVKKSQVKINKQCTYNITLRRVRESLLLWKSNKYYTFVRACVPEAWACDRACTSMQLVCAILWRHLWLLWLHHTFRHYLINGTIFEKS
jgi:hypothetical protein